MTSWPAICLLICGLCLGGETVQGVAPAPPDSTDLKFLVAEGDTLWLLKPLEVVGSRVPVALPGLLRSVTIISGGDLARQPGRSAAELLQTVPGVVVGQRQQYGAQADLSIRGSTFEQVQVLLDGFPAGDPQTGHHLMDLPLGRSDIARLEILPGHGSALYGSGAFGGTVNVVTRRPGPDSGGQISLTGGAGTWGAAGSLDLVSAEGGNSGPRGRLSIERFKTDGHDLELPDGTMDWSGNDADIWTATQRFTTTAAGREFDLFTGYAQRAFGAVDFYAPYASWERTRTLFAAARYNQRLGEALTIEPRLSVRRHADRFVLLRDDPQVYTNDHLTRVVNGELRGLLDLGDSDILALSLEGAYEDIVSEGVRSGVTGPALGEHLRRRASLAVEYDHYGRQLGWQLGLRTDLRSQQAARVTGTGAVSWALSPGLQLKGGAGSVYRVPTYTELYYTDPVNLGDSGLAPELGWAWELGCELQKGPWSGQATYFERREEDRIEWVRRDPVDPDSAAPWQASNIAEGMVHGWELRGAWNHRRGHRLEIGWAGLSQSRTLPATYEGKYELLTPQNQWLGAGTLAAPLALDLTLTGRYLEHTGGPDDFRHIFVLDGRLGWRHRRGWFASLVGTNLLDRRYQEVPGVTMPGILLTTTLGKSF